MGLRDDLAADLAAAVGDYDQVFEWSGRSFPAVRTTAPSMLSFADGGAWGNVSERITVALPLTDIDGNVVDVIPDIGDLIDGGTLQVQKSDPNVGSLTLWIGSPLPAPGGA